MNSDTKSLSPASSNATDPLDELAEYLRAMGKQVTAHDVNGAFTSWLSALECVRQDARRYRWLHDIGDETWVPLGKRGYWNKARADDYIDAAMRNTP